jgi:hypothetical protein
MSLYETYVLPRLLDLCCGTEGFQNKRSQIVPLAYGRILEIGIGSGLNFDHYNFQRVEEIIGVDPAVSSVAMARSYPPRLLIAWSLVIVFAPSLILSKLWERRADC